MSTEPSRLILLALTVLAAGLAGSLGVSTALHRASARIRAWPMWVLILWSFFLLAISMGGVAWTVVTVLQVSAGQTFPSGWVFAGFGFAAGALFAVPTAPRIWLAARREARRLKNRKPPSRRDRVTFADELRRQVEAALEGGVSITTKLEGEQGTVLVLGGPITREQGERLVRTLRADFEDVGIERVESETDGKRWWVRV